MIRLRLLRALIVGLATLMTIGAAIPATALGTGDSSGEIGFLGANPSGKPGHDGRPLISRPVGEEAFVAKSELASFSAECPSTVHCVVVPAAYEANGGNIEDYGNYDLAHRPTDMKINTIVIHDTEGDLQSVLTSFQNPRFYASAHYVINDDGTIYQMVQTKNVAWHAGNWYTNMHSIGIEHVGHAANSNSYTPAMYRASAELVKYLTHKFGIVRDRMHIVGHDSVPTATAGSLPSAHVDPGPYWDWSHYMALVGLPVPKTPGPGGLVTIFPNFQFNRQELTGCIEPGKPETCPPAGARSTNFVQLRTQPSLTAPFFTDPVIGQGSMDIGSVAGRLTWGQTFGLAGTMIDQGGIWYGVWVNGVKGWFYSPWSAPLRAYPSMGKYVTVKTGRATAPLYGRPSPETSAYPAGFLDTPPASFWIPFLAPQASLPYTLASGQKYTLADAGPVVNDQFYAWSSTADRTRFPYDHTVFTGQTKFYLVQSGNRYGYVKASDVDVH